MRKIKILRVIARLNIGGPAVHAVLLTEGLDKSKFDSLLVCGSVSKDEADMSYYAIDKNVKPYFIPELRRDLDFFKDMGAFKRIYSLIKAKQPDVIHTHTAKAGALGRLAAISYNFLNHRKRIKIIHTFHGHIFEGYFSKFKTKLFILIEQFLGLFTCKIITVSESLKEQLISLGIGNKDKIEVIPLGFELDRLLSIPPRDSAVINIGIVGRLVPIKNHRLFLEAAAKVIRDNPRMKLGFKIIGDGELRGDLEKYVQKLGISNYVDFLGWQKDLVRVYSDLDIVTLTSINEGTPVSLIEAMAAGKAIVATDVGGVRDLLGNEVDTGIRPNANFKVLERGVIVRPGDSFSFARALILILQNNELRKNMSVHTQHFARTSFTKDRLIRDMEMLYDNILNRT